MIHASVIPCLSSGLAKNNKIWSMFVLFSLLFGHFESLTFSKIVDKPCTKAVRQHILGQFFKSTTKITINFFPNNWDILTKK